MDALLQAEYARVSAGAPKPTGPSAA